MGHERDENGTKLNGEKVEATMKLKQPENKTKNLSRGQTTQQNFNRNFWKRRMDSENQGNGETIKKKNKFQPNNRV